MSNVHSRSTTSTGGIVAVNVLSSIISRTKELFSLASTSSPSSFTASVTVRDKLSRLSTEEMFPSKVPEKRTTSFFMNFQVPVIIAALAGCWTKTYFPPSESEHSKVISPELFVSGSATVPVVETSSKVSYSTGNTVGVGPNCIGGVKLFPLLQPIQIKQARTSINAKTLFFIKSSKELNE